MKKQKLSLKDFVKFNIFIYPLAFPLWIYKAEVSKFLFNSELTYIALILTLLIALDWMWGQKKLKNYLLVAATVVGVAVMTFHFTDEYWGLIGAFVFSLIAYSLFFLIFLFAQFLMWIPFLIKYTWYNRHSLSDLKW